MIVSAPPGVKLLSYIFNFEYKNKSKLLNQGAVLLLTFLAYASLHACRKALPVVKNRLQGNCSSANEVCYNGFDPFDKSDHSAYFSLLDMIWGFSYAIGMILIGHVADKSSRKFFLVASLLGTGIFMCAFGLGYYLDIHNFWYYAFFQFLNGVIQSGGWPTILAIVSSWLSKTTMGTVLGIWGNHYAVGNIMGQSIAAVFVDNQWGMSFIANGLIAIFISIVVLLFLASNPKAMGYEHELPIIVAEHIQIPDQENENILTYQDIEAFEDRDSPISFLHALLVPGVLEFSFSLFFCKIVIYTFLFWLPYYIHAVGITGYSLTPTTAALLATLFDIGGIFGNIVSGVLMDIMKAGGTLCLLLQMLSCGSILIFSIFGHRSYYLCVVLLIVSGFFVNSPHSLITGTISANLGNHPSITGNRRATATISAIVDGIGAFGAAISPFIVNHVSYFGWDYVMYVLMASCFISGLFLIRLVKNEIIG